MGEIGDETWRKVTLDAVVPCWTVATTVAVGQIPAEQLIVMQQVEKPAPVHAALDRARGHREHRI